MDNPTQTDEPLPARPDDCLSPCFFAHGDEEYGVGTVVRSLAGGLLKRGGAPTVACWREGPLAAECRALGVRVLVLGVGEPRGYAGGVGSVATALLSNRAWARRVSTALAGALGGTRPSAYVVQWPNEIAVAGRVAQAGRVPCYWIMPNEVGSRWPLGINARYYRGLCRRCAVSPLPNSRYTGRTLGTGLDDRVVYLGVDADRFDPAAVRPIGRHELGVPEAATVVGVVARLHESKGQEPLLRAVAALSAPFPDLHLLLVGGPTESDFATRLRTIAGERGCSDRLHFTGWTAEPERYYDAIDIAVNPRIDPEPFGLSVVEAMMMLRPPLVHALGGPAETVRDGYNGWHVDAATPAAYEAALRRVLSERDRWPEMQRTAREHAVEHFSVDAFVDRYLAIARADARDRA
ncbi:glycosyltransferase family 4 protein [Botrimarina sp.]|uniref:glycosyltransferase family 4 protein n=1 Tax=Botrimarina sp. TaxID=2795802 RepID=UPI0032ED95E7